jgi:hypothetical protein
VTGRTAQRGMRVVWRMSRGGLVVLLIVRRTAQVGMVIIGRLQFHALRKLASFSGDSGLRFTRRQNAFSQQYARRTIC